MNNTTSNKKRKHEIKGTVIRSDGWKGYVIGQVINDTGYKDVSARTGFIHRPEEAIAFTINALHAMQAAGAEYVEVLDTDNGIRYKTTIQNYFEHGEKFCYGAKWGEQIKLTLPNFLQSVDPEYASHTSMDAQEYFDSDGTHEDNVKPLLYKSNAPKGATFTKGKPKQLDFDFFGGRNE